MGAGADAAQAPQARRGRRLPSDPLEFKEVGVRHPGCLATRRWLGPQSLHPGAAPHAPRSIAPPIDSGNVIRMGRDGDRHGGKPSNAHVVHRRGGPGAQQGCPQVRRMVRTNLDGPAGHSSECAGCHHLIRGQASFTTDQCLCGVLAPPRSAVRGSRGTRRGSARRVESRRARRRGPRSASPVPPPWPRAQRASCASMRVRESKSTSLSVSEFIESLLLERRHDATLTQPDEHRQA